VYGGQLGDGCAARKPSSFESDVPYGKTTHSRNLSREVAASIWQNETDSGVHDSVALIRIFRTDNGREIGPEIGACLTAFVGHTDVGRRGSTETAAHFKRFTGGARAYQNGCEPHRLEIPPCLPAPMAIRPGF
jgi:hypothetical protein